MKNYTYKIKLSLINKTNKESFMGIGLIWLLENIDKYKSINKASNEMNMSYIKALKILNRLEKNLNNKLIIRTNGGNGGGGSSLTEFGKSFLKKYKHFQEKVNNFTKKEFKKIF